MEIKKAPFSLPLLLKYLFFSLSIIEIPFSFILVYLLIMNAHVHFWPLVFSSWISSIVFFVICYFLIDRISENQSLNIKKAKNEIIFSLKKRNGKEILILPPDVLGISFHHILFDRLCKSKTTRICIHYKKNRKNFFFSLLILHNTANEIREFLPVSFFRNNKLI